MGNYSRHGMFNTPTYQSWQGMKIRCSYASQKSYKNYGGRGITYIAEWAKFENFYKDMGDSPADTTLERLNNNEGYSKDNCVWTTRNLQALNQRVRLDNISGVKGVRWRASSCVWVANGTLYRKQTQLYWGPDFFEACCARKSWENRAKIEVL